MPGRVAIRRGACAASPRAIFAKLPSHHGLTTAAPLRQHLQASPYSSSRIARPRIPSARPPLQQHITSPDPPGLLSISTNSAAPSSQGQRASARGHALPTSCHPLPHPPASYPTLSPTLPLLPVRPPVPPPPNPLTATASNDPGSGDRTDPVDLRSASTSSPCPACPWSGSVVAPFSHLPQATDSSARSSRLNLPH